MGLIQKKDEKSVIDGIEVIGRGEGPDGVDENPVELVAGESAEHIAAGTTAAAEDAKAEAQMIADADDEALKPKDDEGDAADDAEASPVADHAAGKRGGHRLPANHGVLFLVLAVVLIIVAGIGGYFVGNGGFGAKGAGTATLSEDQLDTPVATWSYNGEKHTVTAREAIEAQYSLDKVKDSDGKYPAPTAETITSYIRNQILLKEAEGRNITVTDDEMKSYAEEQLGSSDYKTMAEQYGLSEDQAKQIVKENTTINKLYQQIVPKDSSAAQPTAPTAPADGNTETASKEYADYIIKLAGDEWDSSKGTWASEDGPYYKALKDEKFTADSATYAQAQSAYYVAYQQYSEQSQSTQTEWNKFANGLYAKADLDLYGLYV